MKRLLYVFLIGLLLGSGLISKADEGMWLPMLVDRLNYVDMQKEGLQLTAEELYSVNNSSLKDAIVGLSGGGVNGFFCTGNIVSDKGLLFTNHHCGYGAINALSSVENNYLVDGFWAYSHEEELPAPGMAATFLIRIENVSDSIVPFLNDDMTEAERGEKVGKISKRLRDAAEKDTHYKAVVKAFYNGNEYYLFLYETFTDVRFVGAPPESIGKYGGDTDNWMWPRHTGDFSVFRVYMGKDGNPADYSEDNVPYKPKHFLPVSLDGVKQGDFAMIYGYPGSTNRYASSWNIKYALDGLYPSFVDASQTQLEVLKEDMDANPALRNYFASSYAGTANTWKNFIGQTQALKKLNVIERKKGIEAEFENWMNQSADRKEKYGEVFSMLKEGYEGRTSSIKPIIYGFMGWSATELVGFAGRFTRLSRALEQKPVDEGAIANLVERLNATTDRFFEEYYIETDKKVLAAMLELYDNKMDAAYIPEGMKKLIEKNKKDYKAAADYLFEKSLFADKEEVKAFLAKPKAKTLRKDLLFSIIKEQQEITGGLQAKSQAFVNETTKANRLFVHGLQRMWADKTLYPDANSSMRITYGTVQDYYPADAIHYDFRTTVNGILEKEDPSNPEFIVDEKLKELILKKDFGRYAEDGELYTCFLTTNDITGGNSGSGVINGRGELIGLAFDGNWEAMSGDILFEKELQRCINLDVRYLLFIVDKMAGATNLINELTLVKHADKPVLSKEVKKVAEAIEE